MRRDLSYCDVKMMRDGVRNGLTENRECLGKYMEALVAIR